MKASDGVLGCRDLREMRDWSPTEMGSCPFTTCSEHVHTHESTIMTYSEVVRSVKGIVQHFKI